jgi:hypothetical protein
MFNTICKRHLLIIRAWPRREAQHGWRHQVSVYFERGVAIRSKDALNSHSNEVFEFIIYHEQEQHCCHNPYTPVSAFPPNPSYAFRWQLSARH